MEIEERIYSEDSELEGVEVGIGAEAVQRLLEDLQLEEEAEKLREQISEKKGAKTRQVNQTPAGNR